MWDVPCDRYSSPTLFRIRIVRGRWGFRGRKRTELSSEAAQRWAHLTRGVLGKESTNLDKLGGGGEWGSYQIPTGPTFNLDLLTAALHVWGNGWGAYPVRAIFEIQCAQLMDILSARRLRGHLEHSKSTDAAWNLANGQAGAILGFPDEQSRCVRLPNPDV